LENVEVIPTDGSSLVYEGWLHAGDAAATVAQLLPGHRGQSDFYAGGAPV